MHCYRYIFYTGCRMRRHTNIFIHMVRVYDASAFALHGNLLRWTRSKRTNANTQLSKLERTQHDEKFVAL